MNRHLFAFARSWALAFAAITALLALLGPLIAEWPLAARTVLLSGLMVAVMQMAAAAIAKSQRSRR